MSQIDERLMVAQQNNNNDEYENKIYFRGDILASGIALLMGAIMMVIEYIMHETMDYGVLALALCIVGVSNLHNGIKLKIIYHIVIGIIAVLLSLVFFVAFIGKQVA